MKPPNRSAAPPLLSPPRHAASYVTVDHSQIYAEYRSNLLGFLRSRTDNDHDAEDILHDVFEKVLVSLDQLREPDSLRPWLYQVTRNALADHYRRRKPAIELPENLVADAEVEDAAQALAECLQPMIDALPARYREAVQLSEIDGLPLRLVAETEGISLSGAKSRVQRGRKKLKDMLIDCCHIELSADNAVIDYTSRHN